MSSGVNMSDNEVEEVSFLPGESAVSKRAVYEPSRVQRCRQLVCSRAAAVSLLVLMALFLLLLALVAAFARPASTSTSCPTPEQQGLAPTTPPPAKEKTYIATNGEPFPWRDIRLPTSVLPSLYTLQLHVNISTSAFQGQVKVALKVVSRTDFLVIHLKDLNVTHFDVTSQTTPGSPIRVTKHLVYPENEQMLLKLDRDLDKDEEVTVHIEFKAALVKKLNGLYKSTYKTAKGEEREIVATHFEPVAARSAFPCLDEPALKANFSVSLVREPRHVALFNTPLTSTRQLGGGLLVDQFQTTVRMSTYLVAIVISDFKSIENTTSQGIKVRVFAPEDQIGQAEYALQSAVKILDYYNSFFGVPYPLPKQDLVAIPDFEAGAMENWGLILYRMSSLLYHPQLSTRTSKQWVCTVIAHELAHQWFGNLVTMEWWDDLWLNEGFASLVEYIGCNFNEPDLKLLELFEVDALHVAFIMDSLSNSHPIHVAVSNPDTINELFDKISYDKGASILRMLREVLGEENFHEGLKAYLNTYKYGNARTDQLWESLQQHVGDNFKGMSVKAMMDTWTKQMNFPVVTVTRQGGQLQITQERFLSNPDAAKDGDQTSPFHYKWYIPFTYVVSESPSTGSQQLVWMNRSSAQASVPASTTWVKGNVGAYGVYRVNYDPDNWRALSDQLLKGHEIFSYADRASLLDDALAFGRSGTASPVVSLNLTRYLAGETHYVPWRIALMGLGFLKRRLTGTEAFASLKSYMLELMATQLTSLGWEDRGNSLDIYLRQTLLYEAIRLGHKDSILKGKQLFVDLMKNGSSVPVNLRKAVMLAGVMYGLEGDWDLCWRRYQQTQVASEKLELLTALTYTQDVSLLSTLLTRLLQGEIPAQDGSTVLTLVAGNPSGQLLAWHFLQEHWAVVFKWYGSGTFSMARIILGLTSDFDSEFDLKQVEAFFTGRDVGSGKRAVQQGLETIRMNIRWRQQFEKEVSDWLNAATKRQTAHAV